MAAVFLAEEILAITKDQASSAFSQTAKDGRTGILALAEADV
jgi:hypothetical protein